MDQTEADIKVKLHLTTDDADLKSILESCLHREIEELKSSLGIPGQTEVELHFDTYPVRLLVNGFQSRYAELLTRRLHFYINEIPENPDQPNSSLSNKLFRQPEIGASPQEMQSWATNVGMLVVEIIKLNPSSLLGKSNFHAYWKSLELSHKAPDGLFKEFKEILDLRLSLANKQAVTETITYFYDQQNESGDPLLGAVKASLKMFRKLEYESEDDLGEAIIESLSSPKVIVSINEEYFREITSVLGPEEGDNYFGMMRDGLFYELGIKYPDFKIEPSANLKKGAFQFKINDLMTPPQYGLKKGECLVSDTVDRLTLLNIKGVSTTNPENGTECSIISWDVAEIAEKAGLTTWNGMGYFVLCFSAELRSHGRCFVNTYTVRYWLDQLETVWPKLVETLRDHQSIGMTTKILRLLIGDQLSIRNLHQIIEAILERDYVKTDPQKDIILDDRLPLKYPTNGELKENPETIVEYVRSRMKEYISHKYTRGGNTLVVYLLDPKIEDILDASVRDRGPLSKDDCDKIVEAIRYEVGTLPPGSQNPVVLTVNTLSSYFRNMIRDSFPHLAVLAYTELSPDMNIQPIARISLPD